MLSSECVYIVYDKIKITLILNILIGQKEKIKIKIVLIGSTKTNRAS
jgi:hypothetical protein